MPNESQSEDTSDVEDEEYTEDELEELTDNGIDTAHNLKKPTAL